MKSPYSSLGEATALLREFRATFMKGDAGAVAGLQRALDEGTLTVGIVEDCVQTSTYRKQMKLWLKNAAAAAIVQGAVKLEVVCLAGSSNHLVCYDDTFVVAGKSKQVRAVLQRASKGAASFELYVDTAFFDGGKRW